MRENILAFDKSNRRIDANGMLHVENCNISKATVNKYYGREIPNYKALGLNPEGIYKLLRDPKELEKAAPTSQTSLFCPNTNRLVLKSRARI